MKEVSGIAPSPNPVPGLQDAPESEASPTADGDVGATTGPFGAILNARVASRARSTGTPAPDAPFPTAGAAPGPVEENADPVAVGVRADRPGFPRADDGNGIPRAGAVPAGPWPAGTVRDPAPPDGVSGVLRRLPDTGPARAAGLVPLVPGTPAPAADSAPPESGAGAPRQPAASRLAEDKDPSDARPRSGDDGGSGDLAAAALAAAAGGELRPPISVDADSAHPEARSGRTQATLSGKVLPAELPVDGASAPSTNPRVGPASAGVAVGTGAEGRETETEGSDAVVEPDVTQTRQAQVDAALAQGQAGRNAERPEPPADPRHTVPRPARVAGASRKPAPSTGHPQGGGDARGAIRAEAPPDGRDAPRSIGPGQAVAATAPSPADEAHARGSAHRAGDGPPVEPPRAQEAGAPVSQTTQRAVAAWQHAPASTTTVMHTSAQGQPAHPPGVDEIRMPPGTAGWDEAVGERVLWHVGHGHGRAEFRLNPPDLGPVEVRITVQGDEAKVHFTSAHGAVRDALEAALPRLRELFVDSGIRLADAQVSARHSAQDQGARDGRETARSWSPGPSDGTAAMDLESADPPTRIVRSLLDLYV